MANDSEKNLSLVKDLEEPSPAWQSSMLKKSLVVFITSFVTLTACFSSTSLFSAATQVSQDLKTTPEVINAISAGVLFTMGLSNFVWSPLVPLLGRLVTYNSCIVVLLIWTVAAALAPDMETFAVFKIMSGFQGTFFHVTGQALLAEYFPPVQRGTATGFFLAGTVLGPPLGPLVAGIVVTFTSWRVILYIQAGMILLALIMSLLFLKDSGKAPTITKPSALDVIKCFSPLEVFKLMRFPNLSLTDMACGLLSWSQYALLSSPHHILITQYGLTSPLVSGLFYISPAAGFLVGTLVGGRLSDRTVRAWIKERGHRLPQDRLRSGFVSWFLIIPVASLLFGWSVEKRIGGLALPILAAFFSAAGILAAFAGLNTYCAEVMPASRATAIASKYVVQYSFSALACGVTLPMINAIGVGLETTVSVVLVYIAGGLCVVTALYGSDMQQWVDHRWPLSSTTTKPLEEV